MKQNVPRLSKLHGFGGTDVCFHVGIFAGLPGVAYRRGGGKRGDGMAAQDIGLFPA